MAFEPDRYEREVIRPMRGRRDPLTDDDLLRRYAIEPGLPDLKAHLRRVRTYWNQTASGPDSRAQVCKRLLAADEELQRRPGVELTDPAWWRQYAVRRDAGAQQTIAQLAADLRQAYPTGLVTRVQVAAAAREYPGLDAAQIGRAVRQAGLRVAEEVELPADSGLDRTAYRELGRRLHEAGTPTVVHLLHPGLARPFTLVHRFAVDGEPSRRLDQATLEARIAEADRAADSPAQRARRAALRLLQTGLRAGADLRVVALRQVVEALAEGRSGAVADALLVRQATRIGLAQSDAELVVASLPTGTAAPGTAGAAALRDLLADGRLRAAQAALGALPATDPERAGIAAEIARLEQELGSLLGEAEQAVRDSREDRAERVLAQAARIAGDDEDVRRRAERLPVPPPRELRATVAGDGVRLDWQPPHSAATDLRYRVLRRSGAPPAGPRDGTLVAQTGSTGAADSSPPVARDLHYAVFATGNRGGSWSRAATASAMLVPPTRHVTAQAGPDRITLSWQAHPSTIAVRVRRTEGRPPAGTADGIPLAAGPGTLVDRQVREGVDYFYALVAVFHDEQHREVPARAMIVSAAPRPEARPLDGLRVEPVGRAGPVVRVRAAWPAAAGTVRIRYAAGRPPWGFGTVLATADAERYGTGIAGAPEPHGDDLVLEADVPAGPQVYVPFTVGSAGAVVGRAVHAGQAEPVRELVARRTGDVVTATWVWPADTGVVEVAWQRPDVAAEVFRLTRGAYVDGTGCVLPACASGGTLTVRAIAVGPAGEALSDPADFAVPGRPLSLRYALRRPSGLRERLAGGRLVEIVADRDCDGVDLAVVVAPGQVKPLAADRGTVAGAYRDLRLVEGEPLTLPFRLPKVAKPFWIRCFVTRPDGVTVVDPPVAELRVP